MRLSIAASLLSLAFFSTPCLAQIVSVTPGTSYLAVSAPPGAFGGVCGATGNCVNPDQGVPLNTFATSSNVASQFATVNSQITSLNSSLVTANGQIGAINGQIVDLYNGLRRQTSFAAAVGAMRDAIPNDGDRFAVRGSFATVGSAVGGGFSASANLDNQFRATINYAGSRGENVVSGGLNFSFH